MGEIIKYDQISNEEIMQIFLVDGGFNDVLIIHEFTNKNNEKDYIVIGKLKHQDATVLRGVTTLSG